MIALTLLLIIFGYVLVAIFVGYLIHRISKRRLSKFSSFGIMLSLPFLFAVVSYLPGYIKLQSLCNADDRLAIYKPVKAEGYLFASNSRKSCIGSSWQTLLDHDYQYVECSTEKYIDNKFSEDNKFYRFTVEDEGYEGCDFTDNKIKYDQKKYSEKHKNKFVGKCLSRIEIDEPKSRHMNLFQSGYIDSRGEHNVIKPDNYREIKGLISFTRISRIDRVSNEILSIGRNYTLHPGGAKSSFISPISCDENRFINIKDVFIP